MVSRIPSRSACPIDAAGSGVDLPRDECRLRLTSNSAERSRPPWVSSNTVTPGKDITEPIPCLAKYAG